jgi:hypothetical protein
VEQKLHGASEFRTKARSIIALDVSASISGSVANTQMLVTRKLFGSFCVKQAEQAAGEIAPGEALGMLEQQSD